MPKKSEQLVPRNRFDYRHVMFRKCQVCTDRACHGEIFCWDCSPEVLIADGQAFVKAVAYCNRQAPKLKKLAKQCRRNEKRRFRRTSQFAPDMRAAHLQREMEIRLSHILWGKEAADATD